MKPPLNVQYGCGLSAPEGWLNFDASPTLWLQKLPLLGNLITKVKFPPSVKYGNIVKGLPGIEEQSCDAVYCSHVLEHLSLNDCKVALRNTYSILKTGGIFRCVLPDLESYIHQYLANKKDHPATASHEFMRISMLGIEVKPKGFVQKISSMFGNSHHLWMWDSQSLTQALLDAGFKSVRNCSFNDSSNASFKQVEDSNRFWSAIALEAIK